MAEAPSGRVGVVVPAYNASAFVLTTLRSVLAQTHADLRVVVVDDGSTDGTADLVRTLDDPRLSVHTHANVGVGRSRNVGASLVDGDVLAFLDADDVWEADAVERRLAALDEHPEWGAVGGLMHHIDRGGRVLGLSGVPVDAEALRRVAAAELLPCPLSSILFRRTTFAELGGFDEGLVVHVPAMVEDLDLLARLAQRTGLGVLPSVVGGYRMHGGSGSALHFRNQREGARFVRARLAARATGGDLTWLEFERSRRPSLRRWLGDTSALLYRRAGLAAAEGDRVGMVVNGVGAVLCGPRYCTTRLRAQRGRLLGGGVGVSSGPFS